MATVIPITPTTKMRIKAFSNEGLVYDRLVEQETEFRIGPKDVHKGPIALEFNLNSQEDVDGMIEYIRKLRGDLPLGVVKKIKSPKGIDNMLTDKEPLLDLMKTVKAKAKTQEELITMLREYNFRFLAADYITDLFHDKEDKDKLIILKTKHIDEGYQFMARMQKESKDPMNDKYDFRLTFGIKIVGEKVEKVQVYLWGKYEATWKLGWSKPKENNFKKTEKLYTFPEFMTYIERRKWRLENRKILSAKEKGETLEPSKQYTRWAPYVKQH